MNDYDMTVIVGRDGAFYAEKASDLLVEAASDVELAPELGPAFASHMLAKAVEQADLAIDELTAALWSAKRFRERLTEIGADEAESIESLCRFKGAS